MTVFVGSGGERLVRTANANSQCDQPTRSANTNSPRDRPTRTARSISQHEQPVQSVNSISHCGRPHTAAPYSERHLTPSPQIVILHILLHLTPLARRTLPQLTQCLVKPGGGSRRVSFQKTSSVKTHVGGELAAFFRHTPFLRP